jgi:hypothetical protein
MPFRAPTEHVNTPTTSPRRVHTASNTTNNTHTSMKRVPTASTRINASNISPSPSMSTKTTPVSSNNRVAPTEPTVVSSTADMASIAARTAADEGIRGVRKQGKEDAKAVRIMPNTTDNAVIRQLPKSFDWQKTSIRLSRPLPSPSSHQLLVPQDIFRYFAQIRRIPGAASVAVIIVPICVYAFHSIHVNIPQKAMHTNLPHCHHHHSHQCQFSSPRQFDTLAELHLPSLL